MRTIAVAGAGLLLALTGCGNESGAGAPDAGSLTGRTYLSSAVTEDGRTKQLVPNSRVRLTFTDDGRLIAEAGCNSMQSPVDTGDGKLAVDEQLQVTAMGCDDARHKQDSWLSGLLRSGPSWTLEADRLTVTSGGTTITLTDRETAEPDLALDGTKWSLETVVSGETASHQAGSEKVWITLNGDRVTGSTGCNELQGKVARDTGKLTFGEIATTRRACAGDAGKLEQTLLGTLEGTVTYEVDANRLELRAAGDGLDFTGAR
ncbi:META domain-containing protein [Kribbella turkmenica]|uniref:META domain-containing protein n=1 Tax=Kribbella turkmenica TaxID=2530375 RepID=A0A4R4X4M6_9ACTN|nr:META domain-containing protein [Kribbella turkmenica]TDD25244.1 META domain-containing protein [Kribbella turkmenica]